MSAYEAIYKIMSTMPVHTGEITAEMRGMITATKTKNIQTILAYPLKVGGTYMRVALIHLLSFHYQAHLSRGSYVAVGPNREPYFPLIFNQHVLTDTTPRAAVMHLHTVATGDHGNRRSLRYPGPDRHAQYFRHARFLGQPSGEEPGDRRLPRLGFPDRERQAVFGNDDRGTPAWPGSLCAAVVRAPLW